MGLERLLPVAGLHVNRTQLAPGGDGRLRLDPLHTDTVSLDDMGDAFSRLASAPEEVKILVNPSL